jgi:hypothetical protein
VPPRRSVRLGCCPTFVFLIAATGCGEAPDVALERLMEARRLTAELLVQFTKAGDAANRAVMADTDERSATFVREAQQAEQEALRDAQALKTSLASLG